MRVVSRVGLAVLEGILGGLPVEQKVEGKGRAEELPAGTIESADTIESAGAIESAGTIESEQKAGVGFEAGLGVDRGQSDAADGGRHTKGGPVRA